MKIVDLGSGAPVVIVPGIQGRWEWMKPGVEALAKKCRVVTFSLADEPTCGGNFDPSHGFDSYVDQVKDAMDLAGLAAAVVAGVSYSGLVAAAFAARYPERAAGLAMVSALPPRWTPDRRVRFYLKAPVLLSPLFFVNSLRLYKEIAVANPGVLRSMGVAARHGFNVLTHNTSPARMARRVHALEQLHLERELADVHVPTLVVTGEPGLDRVVPVRLTEDYLRLWPHAEHVTIAHTGHLGLITRPDAFADAVAPFVERQLRESGRGRDPRGSWREPRRSVAKAGEARDSQEKKVG